MSALCDKDRSGLVYGRFFSSYFFPPSDAFLGSNCVGIMLDLLRESSGARVTGCLVARG